VLPVTVLVALDGLGVGFGVGFEADFVGVGEAFADDEAPGAVTGALVGVADDCGDVAGTELTGAELAGAELAAAELTGVDESGAVAESPGVPLESATGRGALACVVLKPSRTMSPATVAMKTEMKRRMTHLPLKLRNNLEFE
jgi:hypothetical protein